MYLISISFVNLPIKIILLISHHSLLSIFYFIHLFSSFHS
nr:MAG TPA: hypothetical protein [Caudoviricetes sp.]